MRPGLRKTDERATQLFRPVRQLVTMCSMSASTDDERAWRLRELGEISRRNGDLVSAQACYEEASNLLRGSQDRLKFAHTVRHLGDIYTERQDWSQAEPCFIEALRIYRNHPSPPTLDLANAIRAYAVLKSSQGTHEKARELWAEAGQLYEAAGIPAGVEECKRRLSA
jgi:tetratricopeptide (TPR) repeat protein